MMLRYLLFACGDLSLGPTVKPYRKLAKAAASPKSKRRC